MSNREVNNVNYRTKVETATRHTSTNLNNIDVINNVIKKVREQVTIAEHELLGYCFYSNSINIKTFKDRFGADGPFFNHVVSKKTAKPSAKIADNTPLLECYVWTPELCGMLPFSNNLIPVRTMVKASTLEITNSLTTGQQVSAQQSIDELSEIRKFLENLEKMEPELRKIAMLPKYYKLNENLETVPFGQMVKVRHSDTWTAASSWHAGSLEEVLNQSWNYLRDPNGNLLPAAELSEDIKQQLLRDPGMA